MVSSPPKRPSPRAEDPASSRADILEAATQAFMEAGFAGARVDDIALKASANKAMIYYHFRSKHGLYKAVLLGLFGDVLTEVARLKTSEAGPEEKLRALYSRIAQHFTDTPALPHIMLREILAGGKAMDEDAARTLSVIVDFVAHTLNEGVRAGVFREVHPILLHKTMLGQLMLHFAGMSFRERVFPLGRPGVRPPGNDEMLAHLMEVLHRSLAPADSFPQKARAAMPHSKIQSRQRKTK